MERKNSHPINRDGLLNRSVSRSAATTSSDFVLQWGNRKKLRCMKVHVKHNKGASNEPVGPGLHQRAAVRADRLLVRSDLNDNKNNSKNPIPNPHTINNGSLNLRHRPASSSHRILRNSESAIAMKGNSNGLRGLASPDRVERKGTSTSNNANNTHHDNNNANISNHNNENHHHATGGGGSGSSEMAHDSKKAAAATMMWPKFVIALTNKEKEEDFMAIKGSKLPQRPKKRAKLIQRTLNLVSPGAWLCDLTLERYEVREKKVPKKRPRGLRAMGNMIDSDSK